MLAATVATASCWRARPASTCSSSMTGGLAPLHDQTRRDLLELLDDRHQTRSTIVTSQLPLEHWHGYLGAPTLADAILDRLVHDSYRFALRGESLRKRAAKTLTSTALAD